MIVEIVAVAIVIVWFSYLMYERWLDRLDEAWTSKLEEDM